MLIRNLLTILRFVLGLLCVQNTIARSLPAPAWGPQPSWGPPQFSALPPPNQLLGLGVGADANIYTGLDTGIGLSADISVSALSDLLFNQLMESNVFRSSIFAQINTDVAINIGASIAQSLVSEMGLRDSYLATNLLTNALTSIGPGAPPEAYCRALANVSAQIMLNNNILNSANSVSLSNTLSRIILKAVSSSAYGNLGLGIGLGAGVNLGTKLGSAIDLNTRNSLAFASGVNKNVDANFLNGGIGVDAGLGINTGLGIGTGLGINTGLGIGTGLGTVAGLGAGLGLGVGANLGLGAGANAGLGLDVDANAGLGLGVGANAGLGLGVGANAGLGLGVGANAGLGLGVNTGIGTNVNLGAAPTLGVNLGLGSGNDGGANLALGLGGTDLQVGLGTDLDLSVSPDSVTVFKSELTKELLKDNNFRYVFSDYVPSSVSKLITTAISQCLSKAFSIPRSSLLPLEKSIGNLPSDVTPSPELYAQNIVDSLLQCLIPLNLITVASSRLQASIAARAMISGIINFLVISTIPGIGLGVNSNSYNSFFSALSGLEKLPYVGIDAVSSKLPPIVTTAKSSENALQFSKVLLYNLLSSNKFSEVFLLGVPTFTYKVIANALGKSMAESFGSPFSSLFSKIYTNALFTVGNKLNYQIYAKALSEATMNSLYLLGYFSSGNVNIQAAIASSAIIRALATQLKPTDSQVTLFPGVLGLPWSTPITGVAPPDSLLKLGIGVGSNIGVGVGADLGESAEVGSGIGVDVGAGVGLGLGVNAGLGLGVDASLGTNLGLGVNTGKSQNGRRLTRRKRDIDDIYRLDEINFDLDLEELERDLNLAADASLKAGVGVGLGKGGTVNSGLGVNAGLGLNAGLGAGVGVGTGLGVGTRLANGGLGLGVNAGLGANAGLGLGVNAGLGANAGLGNGVGAGIGLGVGTGLAVDADVSNNAQLSISTVLPPILANKLYQSTALYTAIAMTGSRKVINLIAQAMAAEFGFVIAALFLKSYDKNLANNADDTFGPNVIALSLATTDALAGSGMLNSQFNVKTVDQLSTALVAKYSSLIATSLDSKVSVMTPRWTYLLAQEQFQPQLAPGYALL